MVLINGRRGSVWSSGVEDKLAQRSLVALVVIYEVESGDSGRGVGAVGR